jgi:hypothetical protein
MEMKTCSICGIEKPIEKFPNKKTGNFCRQCANNRQRMFVGIEDSMCSRDEKDAAIDILERMGYVVGGEQTVHEQFLDRHPQFKKA